MHSLHSKQTSLVLVTAGKKIYIFARPFALELAVFQVNFPFLWFWEHHAGADLSHPRAKATAALWLVRLAAWLATHHASMSRARHIYLALNPDQNRCWCNNFPTSHTVIYWQSRGPQKISSGPSPASRIGLLYSIPSCLELIRGTL